MMRLNTRWLRFALVGLAGVGVQVVVLTALVDHAGINLQVATLAAVSAAIGHNFVWHLRWTWADRVPATPARLLFARFTAANGLVSLAGNTVVTTLLVEGLRLPVAAASLIAIVTCAVLNYALADLLVFAATRPPPAEGR